MEVALLIARLFLALIFGVAGIAKMADKAGSRRAFIDFGVPESLATVMGWSLPWIEIMIALALIPLRTSWWGATAAFALLLVFVAGIGLNLARGRSPDCRCFGQLHSKPVGGTTLARNFVLASVAGYIVIQGSDNPGLSATGWIRDLRVAEAVNLFFGILIIGLLICTIIFLSRVLKQQSKLFASIDNLRTALDEEGEPSVIVRKEALLPQEGLPIGAIAPKFSLPNAIGHEVSLDDLLGYEKSVLLLFVGPNCWGCKLLLPAARAWQRDYEDMMTIAVLSSGTPDENREKMSKYEIAHLLLDEKSRVADDYQATWTPAAVLIAQDGKIASPVSYGDNAIREWLRNLIAAGEFEPGPSGGRRVNNRLPQVSLVYSVRQIGEMAPMFSLSDLSGNMIKIQDLLGSPKLLLFWHPKCEYSNALYDDLRELETHRPNGAPGLVFIVCGEVEDIKSLEGVFSSRVLLDPAFEIGPLFGTKATPSAILIDADGRVASSLAIGYQNVRALIGLRSAEQQLTAQL